MEVKCGRSLLWGGIFNLQSYEKLGSQTFHSYGFDASAPPLPPRLSEAGDTIDMPGVSTHLRQIILSWLNLRASSASDGSMMPPRRRSTRCSVDSAATDDE